MNAVEQEAWDTVRAMNRAWTSGDVESLRRWFHRDMVAVTPMDRSRLVGAEACIASWTRFVKAAKVEEWAERELRVTLFGGNAAVVSYDYDVSYVAAGTRHRQGGRDLFFLVLADGRWQIVGNAFSPVPSAP